MIAAVLVIWGVATDRILDNVRADRQATAITEEEYDGIPEGATREAVLRRLGEPDESIEVEGEGPPGTETGTSCLSYKEKGAALLYERTFRFCFTDGSLTLKEGY